MLTSIISRVTKIWKDQLRERTDYLRSLPGIPGFNVCLLYTPRFSLKRGPYVVCEYEVSVPSISLSKIADAVESVVTRIIEEIVPAERLISGFINDKIGPNPGNNETPAFSF
jgi:hypothetical protein